MPPAPNVVVGVQLMIIACLLNSSTSAYSECLDCGGGEAAMMDQHSNYDGTHHLPIDGTHYVAAGKRTAYNAWRKGKRSASGSSSRFNSAWRWSPEDLEDLKNFLETQEKMYREGIVNLHESTFAI